MTLAESFLEMITKLTQLLIKREISEKISTYKSWDSGHSLMTQESVSPNLGTSCPKKPQSEKL